MTLAEKALKKQLKGLERQIGLRDAFRERLGVIIRQCRSDHEGLERMADDVATLIDEMKKECV
jgi:hypothetical protein